MPHRSSLDAAVAEMTSPFRVRPKAPKRQPCAQPRNDAREDRWRVSGEALMLSPPQVPPRGSAALIGRMLIVDDDQDIVNYLHRVMKKQFPGVDVAVATNAQVALGLIALVDPQVILTDYVMPGMDGLAFLAAVHAQHSTSYHILLSGFADTKLAMRALNEGHVHAFLEKPIHTDELARAITKAFAEQEARARKARGTTAIISLPARGNVLFVDGDARTFEIARSAFKTMLPEVHVTRAQSAEEGLALLESRSFDLIVSDYRLPDSTGMELLVAARRACPRARGILMTDNPSEGLARQASDEPAVDRFFIRPMSMPAFARAVARLLPSE